nr:unnamed protein product [Callosobruchus analis]
MKYGLEICFLDHLWIYVMIPEALDGQCELPIDTFIMEETEDQEKSSKTKMVDIIDFPKSRCLLWNKSFEGLT